MTAEAYKSMCAATGMTQAALAGVLGRTPQCLSRRWNDKEKITKEAALAIRQVAHESARQPVEEEEWFE